MDMNIPRKVTDQNGKEWTLSVTAGSIMRACRHTGLTIQDLMEMRVPIDALLSAIPYFCDKELDKAGLSHAEFLDLFGIKEITDVVAQFFPAMAEAFPEPEEGEKVAEGKEGEAPLADSGPAATS